MRSTLSRRFSRAFILFAATASTVVFPSAAQDITHSIATESHPLTITLVNQHVVLSYPAATRLDVILRDSQKQLSGIPYYLGAKLVSASQQAKVQSKYQHVIKQLDDLATPQARMVKQQLDQFQFVGRELLELDYDKIRLKEPKNPLLHGQYQLYLTGKSNTLRHKVWLLGLITEPKQVELLPNQDLDIYLDQMNTFDEAETKRPFVIQPDGTIKQPNISYYQPGRVYLAPQAMVFIGFESQTALNQDIANLLRYAVVKPSTPSQTAGEK
ncbi:capsule biosynthesis GfcC family protein [Vibrio tapetis subsp. quintayensis]|uniref:capsule biosynthesis GfcC D2 domain-containing protein n=1 Tax=Vibrio tapetis TaxID=52443 RepID=UPI0025B39A47|nr:capsule biosynthesis GfcC D2 domain-containing protein [Vibrio tapetis]MDN3679497.1 capsule biosynthesis GfcC family protein [Vibrio tapetis subsp. quintayensis]